MQKIWRTRKLFSKSFVLIFRHFISLEKQDVNYGNITIAYRTRLKNIKVRTVYSVETQLNSTNYHRPHAFVIIYRPPKSANVVNAKNSEHLNDKRLEL